MHIGIVCNTVIPTVLYGGIGRVVLWLGRGLHELGHQVTFLVRTGSRCEFAPVHATDFQRPLAEQLPAGLDIVHAHLEPLAGLPIPFCQTIHGNFRAPQVLHPNTLFVSESHARNHNAAAFVHNGLDPADYGPPDLDRSGGPLVFLGKAAWRIKNVRGAIRVARRAGIPLDVLGGYRFNLKMGFRLTLDPRVRFHGMVGGEKKNALLRRGRGLVFPVLWPEPFGIAVAEALYFGLPVFATPYGSLPELVGEDEGFLSASESALAEAAARADAYDRRAIHESWKQRFTHLQMAKKYLTYYEKILSGETLHPAEIRTTLVRTRRRLPWKP